jgi:predicted RNA-binding protein with TRAM domain
MFHHRVCGDPNTVTRCTFIEWRTKHGYNTRSSFTGSGDLNTVTIQDVPSQGVEIQTRLQDVPSQSGEQNTVTIQDVPSQGVEI